MNLLRKVLILILTQILLLTKETGMANKYENELVGYRQRQAAVVPSSVGEEILQASRAELVQPEFSDRFINYVTSVEGLRQDKNKTPFRYASPEGGRDTIGYGHKLTDAEEKSGMVHGYSLNTLTQDQIVDILQKDLVNTRSHLDSDLKKKHNVSFYDLSPRQQEMLMDYQFNLKGGIGSFPNFTKAVINRDWDTASKEYKRYYKKPKTGNVELTRRNEFFYDTYLK